jgi:hypothetical protein
MAIEPAAHSGNRITRGAAASDLPRWLRWAGVLCGWALLSLLILWAMAALWVDLRPDWLGAVLAVSLAAGAVFAALRVRRRFFAWSCWAGGFLLVLVWWLTLQPSNDRDWQSDLAVLAHADTQGDRVTIHNIRNCEYRSATDFDVRHYDKSFDLGKIQTADLFMVYWGSPNMAHTMVSFGFEGGDYVCFSIETRKEKGEGYSAVKGLFRQFELIYIVADERDVVRLRTNHREHEEVYLYRLKGSPDQVRKFFLNYLHRLNNLWERPEWYSAITHNCTTSIRMQRTAADRAPWDWRMLVNGYGDELLHERGLLATNLPFAELKRQSHINERARAVGDRTDFSALIRQGIPAIDILRVKP